MGAIQVSAASERNGICKSSTLNHICPPPEGSDKIGAWLFRAKNKDVSEKIKDVAIYCISKSGAIGVNEKRIIRYDGSWSEAAGVPRTTLIRRVREKASKKDGDRFKALKSLSMSDRPCDTDCSTFAIFTAEVALNQNLNCYSSIDTRGFKETSMNDPVFNKNFDCFDVPEFAKKFPKWDQGQGLIPGDIIITRPAIDFDETGKLKPIKERSTGAGHAYIVVAVNVDTGSGFDELYQQVMDHQFNNIFARIESKTVNYFCYKPYEQRLFGQTNGGQGGNNLRVAFLNPRSSKKNEAEYASSIYAVDNTGKVKSIQNALRDTNTVFVGDSRIAQLRKYLRADSLNKTNEDLYYDLFNTINVFGTWGARLFPSAPQQIPENQKIEDYTRNNTKKAIKMLSSRITNIVFFLGINDVEYEFLWRRRRDTFLREALKNKDQEYPVPESQLPFYEYRNFNPHTERDYAQKLMTLANMAKSVYEDVRVYICQVVDTKEKAVGVANTTDPVRQLAGTVKYLNHVIDKIPSSEEFISKINSEIEKMCKEQDFDYVEFGQPEESYYVADKVHMTKDWFEGVFKQKTPAIQLTGGEGIGQDFSGHIHIDPLDPDFARKLWTGVLEYQSLYTQSGIKIEHPKINPILRPQVETDEQAYQIYKIPEVCDGMPQSGIVANCESVFQNWNYIQKQVHDEWIRQGQPSSYYVAQVSGYYQIAMKHYTSGPNGIPIDGMDVLVDGGEGFGTTGELVTIILENGEFFNAIYGDSKGVGAERSRWGHFLGSPPQYVDIVEWMYMGVHPVDRQHQEILENSLPKAWYKQKIAYIINWGNYLR